MILREQRYSLCFKLWHPDFWWVLEVHGKGHSADVCSQFGCMLVIQEKFSKFPSCCLIPQLPWWLKEKNRSARWDRRGSLILGLQSFLEKEVATSPVFPCLEEFHTEKLCATAQWIPKRACDMAEHAHTLFVSEILTNWMGYSLGVQIFDKPTAVDLKGAGPAAKAQGWGAHPYARLQSGLTSKRTGTLLPSLLACLILCSVTTSTPQQRLGSRPSVAPLHLSGQPSPLPVSHNVKRLLLQTSYASLVPNAHYTVKPCYTSWKGCQETSICCCLGVLEQAGTARK